jgi:hypothetical protein
MLNRSFAGLLLVFLLITSCRSPQAYQSALEAFSQGAELELRQQFAAAEVAPPQDLLQLDALYPPAKDPDDGRTPASYYNAALVSVTTALQGAAQLEQQHMLDNAYAIQALSQWKLNLFDEARTTAAKAEPLLSEDHGDENDVRDLAIMRALPGLIYLDQAFASLQKVRLLAAGVEDARAAGENDRRELYLSIKDTYRQSVADESDGAASVRRGLALIERAGDMTSADEPVLIYLVNARLAGLDTWGDMLQEVFMASRRLSVSSFLPEEADWIMDERGRYDTTVRQTLEELAGLLGDDEAHPVYQFWKSILQGA